LLFGAISACSATAVVHPLDVARVRSQVQGTGSGWMGSLVRTSRESGLAAIYDGLSANLLRQLFYGASRFGTFTTLQDEFRKRRELRPADALPATDKLAAGLCAGAVAGVVGNPADVGLTRMSADRGQPPQLRRHYRNGVDALVRIGREEGVAKGLMRGVVPNVQRALIVNATMLPVYEQCKQTISVHLGVDGLLNQLVSGNVAGFCTAVVVLPVDVVKTRLQNMRAGEFAGATDVLRRTLRSEGVRGLYTGFMPMWFKLGPHTSLSFIAMENLRALYQGGL
jgi:dicarboxylate transporter 10